MTTSGGHVNELFNSLNNALITLDRRHKQAREGLRDEVAIHARKIVDDFTTKLADLFPDVCGICINGDYRLIEEYSLELAYHPNAGNLPDCCVDELDLEFPDKFTKEELQEVLEAAGFLNQEFEEDSW